MVATPPPLPPSPSVLLRHLHTAGRDACFVRLRCSPSEHAQRDPPPAAFSLILQAATISGRRKGNTYCITFTEGRFASIGNAFLVCIFFLKKAFRRSVLTLKQPPQFTHTHTPRAALPLHSLVARAACAEPSRARARFLSSRGRGRGLSAPAQ